MRIPRHRRGHGEQVDDDEREEHQVHLAQEERGAHRLEREARDPAEQRGEHPAPRPGPRRSRAARCSASATTRATAPSTSSIQTAAWRLTVAQRGEEEEREGRVGEGEVLRGVQRRVGRAAVQREAGRRRGRSRRSSERGTQVRATKATATHHTDSDVTASIRHGRVVRRSARNGADDRCSATSLTSRGRAPRRRIYRRASRRAWTPSAARAHDAPRWRHPSAGRRRCR